MNHAAAADESLHNTTRIALPERFVNHCRWVVILMMAFGLQLRAEILFDNTLSYQTNAVYGNFEFGDEIRLSRSTTNLTGFQISYDGEFFSSGRETARVRFYLNDGADTDPSARIIRGPGTMLYDSGPVAIYPGGNVLALSGLSLSLPQTIIWTVEFSGLTGSLENRAGLVIYNPPTTGTSFDDFWRKTETGWQLFRFGGNPVANFGVRAESSENIARLATPVRFANGSMKLDVSGPLGRQFLLEFSTNSVNWVPILTNRLVTGSFSYVHAAAASVQTPFYRVNLLPVVARIISTQRVESGTRVQFEGPLGAIYEIQSSVNGQIWVSVQRGAFPAGVGNLTDPLGTDQLSYRIVVEEVPKVELSNYDTLLDNLFQVEMFGLPGRGYELQATEDFENWTTVNRGIFDFSSGRSTWVDTNTTQVAQKFFRIQLTD